MAYGCRACGEVAPGLQPRHCGNCGTPERFTTIRNGNMTPPGRAANEAIHRRTAAVLSRALARAAAGAAVATLMVKQPEDIWTTVAAAALVAAAVWSSVMVSRICKDELQRLDRNGRESSPPRSDGPRE